MSNGKIDPIILSKSDFNSLNKYLQGISGVKNESHLKRLIQDLELAKLVDDEDFPIDVVQLYRKATIKEHTSNFKYAYTVVMPEHADHKKCRVSVASALGASLMGRSKGQEIGWQTGELQRVFVIVSVSAYRMKI